jgi:cell division protein FtsW (lipid II flippase)
MRTGLAYTSARILFLVISLVVLYLAGARGFLLLALAFLVSALASYVLLSRQREKIAGALNRRLDRVGAKAAEFRERLDEGAAAEDDEAEDAADTQPAGEAAPRG